MASSEEALRDLEERVSQLQLERLRLLGLLEEHLSPDLVQHLLDSENPLKLGGQRETVAVLFCDLRGFTRLSSHASADEVVSLLNRFFHAMTGLLFAHRGTVDKFIGDSIMAFFRGPDPAEVAVRAAACARAMRDAFARQAPSWPLGEGLGMGVAVTLGEVVLGLVGSGKHVDFTVIGSPVNLASRLCAVAGSGEVLVDRALTDALPDSGGWAPLPPQSLKGFEAPVEAFRSLA